MSELIPYITFPGNCEEALNFYASCLDGEVKDISRFDGSPMKVPDNYKQKILHAGLHFKDSIILASDGSPDKPPVIGNNLSLSLEMKDVEKMNKIFEKLSSGGKITMPLQDTFWGARFGMLTDKYGINWMFNCQLKK